MNTLFKFIITIVFVAVLLWLTFANRDAIALVWSPVHDAASVPVAVLILAATVFGFIWGTLIVWLNTAPLRRDRKRKAKDVARLEKELTAATLTPAASAPATPLVQTTTQTATPALFP